MPFSVSEINTRICTALKFIKHEQLSDGSFLSFSSAALDLDDLSTQNSSVHKTTFVTSLILSALENVRSHPHAATIIRRGSRFLLHEKSSTWSWNYCLRENKSHAINKISKIPDDMDDTFAALTALQVHMPHLFTKETERFIYIHLLRTQHPRTKLHNTWLIDYIKYPTWNDVDPVINASVGYFLRHIGIDTSKISGAIAKHLESVDENTLISQYYSSPIVASYFLVRFLGENKFTTETTLSSLPHLSDLSALETALLLTTLMYINTPIKILTPLVDRLMTIPWEARALYVESIKDKIPIYAGSTSLTTAYCVEALSNYLIYTHE